MAIKTHLDGSENISMKLKSLFSAVLLVISVAVIAGACGGSDPYKSGEWKNSSSCGSLTDQRVAELWRVVENGMVDSTISDLEKTAEVRREFGVAARSEENEIGCLIWLDVNR